MNDPRLLREAPDEARSALGRRGGRHLPPLEESFRLEEERRRALKAAEELRAKRNAASQAIGAAKGRKDEDEARRLMAEVAKVKEDLARVEEGLQPLEARARALAMSLPNLPHESVPAGAGPEDNPVVRSGPAPAPMEFKALDHQSLGERLGILDFAAAAKLSGARFALWRGAGARLLRAIISFQLDLHARNGYQEVWPPYLVRPEVLEGTGQLPKFEADLYRTVSSAEKTEEAGAPLFLIPTAEVPLTNLVRDEILEGAKLPLKLTAYTPCFRQEAGSYGKDVRGLIRNHQFDKVELVWVTRPEDSPEALERLTRDAEEVLKALELPFRVVALCAGDLGFSSRKTYDLEVWMPAEERFREISSCSDCGDFQARRMSARFRREAKGAPELVHTLNGSGVAVGRLAAAILENGQRKDGTVRLPKALAPYFGGEVIAEA